MIYNVRIGPGRPDGQIETHDEKVVKTTPGLRWGLGERLRDFKAMASLQRMQVEIIIDQCQRNPLLGTALEPVVSYHDAVEAV